MSRHPHSARLEGFDDDELITMVRQYVDAEVEDIANRIADAAVASTEFQDSRKTKNKLRKSIRPRFPSLKTAGGLWLPVRRMPISWNTDMPR